ncbi:MAG TPA: hypothetical protein HA263_10835 [Methanoregulaceae archaeon]|nr:hypothetical protein [Methanoregulaceae archaeon]
MTTTAQAAAGVEAETLQMVEAVIREHSGEYDRDALWQALPQRIPFAQFSASLAALVDAAKVGIDAAGKVCHVYNPALFARYDGRPDLRIR